MRPLMMALATLTLVLQAAGSIGAELRIFAVGSVGPILRELAPEFERATGNKVEVFASTSGATLKRIRGEQGDVGINSTPMQQELEKTGDIVAGSATVFAKSSAGVAIRKGTTLDVSTLNALRCATRYCAPARLPWSIRSAARRWVRACSHSPTNSASATNCAGR